MRNNFLLFAMVAIAVAAAIASVGCAPRVRIRQSPGPQDTGIRYYRPKPYLRIEPAGQVVTEGKKTTSTPSDETVAISLEYLPDFSEEYSIDVRPGIGVADVSVGLENGWNLTSLNQKLDSQFDENVKAVAELAKAASGFVPSAVNSDGAPSGSTQKFVVDATNVPIGYYESVISKDGCGKKRLYGWRYIGFLPFSPCPTEMCGSQQLACGSIPADLFGIVFENGVMTFKRLDAIGEVAKTERVSVSTGQFVVSTTTQQKLDTLVTAIRRAILVNEGIESVVDAKFAEDSMEVLVSVDLLGAVDEGMTREELIRSMVSHEEVESALLELGNPIPSVAKLTGLARPSELQ